MSGGKNSCIGVKSIMFPGSTPATANTTIVALEGLGAQGNRLRYLARAEAERTSVYKWGSVQERRHATLSRWWPTHTGARLLLERAKGVELIPMHRKIVGGVDQLYVSVNDDYPRDFYMTTTVPRWFVLKRIFTAAECRRRHLHTGQFNQYIWASADHYDLEKATTIKDYVSKGELGPALGPNGTVIQIPMITDPPSGEFLHEGLGWLAAKKIYWPMTTTPVVV